MASTTRERASLNRFNQPQYGYKLGERGREGGREGNTTKATCGRPEHGPSCSTIRDRMLTHAIILHTYNPKLKNTSCNLFKVCITITSGRKKKTYLHSYPPPPEVCMITCTRCIFPQESVKAKMQLLAIFSQRKLSGAKIAQLRGWLGLTRVTYFHLRKKWIDAKPSKYKSFRREFLPKSTND